jgi:hypothetical protein
VDRAQQFIATNRQDLRRDVEQTRLAREAFTENQG